MTVSIIIAVKTWQKNLEECVDKCCQLDYPDFEILVLPDSQQGLSPQIVTGQPPSKLLNSVQQETVPFSKGTVPITVKPAEKSAEAGTVPAEAKILSTKGTVPIQVIPSGAVSPAQKRDIATSYAKGEILAFIDDDAYPAKDWLKNAIEDFKDENIAAVGGPAITPPNDTLRQKASGIIYTSFLVSGKYAYRYTPKKKMEVDDYPTCNFLVRKTVMQELGGFKTDLWPGEDTVLCLEITKKLGKKIIYDPRALVYHHRRPLFLPHLRQISNYALHRGYFVKRYPQTSLKVSYFIPSLFLLFLLAGGALIWFFTPIRIIYLLVITLYLLSIFIYSVSNNLKRTVLFIFCGIILTHLTYGFWFLKGIFSKKLREEIFQS